jgi:hypothetical protein
VNAAALIWQRRRPALYHGRPTAHARVCHEKGERHEPAAEFPLASQWPNELDGSGDGEFPVLSTLRVSTCSLLLVQNARHIAQSIVPRICSLSVRNLPAIKQRDVPSSKESHATASIMPPTLESAEVAAASCLAMRALRGRKS